MLAFRSPCCLQAAWPVCEGKGGRTRGLLSACFNCTSSIELHLKRGRVASLTTACLSSFLLFSDVFLFCLTAIAYVLVGSGLYDEAIRHFSTMLQVMLFLGV